MSCRRVTDPGPRPHHCPRSRFCDNQATQPLSDLLFPQTSPADSLNLKLSATCFLSFSFSGQHRFPDTVLITNYICILFRSHREHRKTPSPGSKSWQPFLPWLRPHCPVPHCTASYRSLPQCHSKVHGRYRYPYHTGMQTALQPQQQPITWRGKE